jgi:hypothetical protein
MGDLLIKDGSNYQSVASRRVYANLRKYVTLQFQYAKDNENP